MLIKITPAESSGVRYVGSESPPLCPLKHKAPEHRTALHLSLPPAPCTKWLSGSAFSGQLPSILPPTRACLEARTSFQTFSHSPIHKWTLVHLPSLHVCKAPNFSLRVETRAWLDCPQNRDHQVGVGCVHVCGSKKCAPSWPRCLLCAFESPHCIITYTSSCHCFLTLNKPSSPWEVSELQSSLGNGINAAMLPDPVRPFPSFSVTLAGWDAELSLPWPSPCRNRFQNRAIYTLYLYSCNSTAFFISYIVSSTVIGVI